MNETGVREFVRRRRSRAEAAELVREFEASGLTRQAFCAGHGVSVAALDKYRRQVAVATHPTVSGAGRLLALEVVADVSASKIGGALWVELANGRRIGVGSGFDAAALQRLLNVLEQV